jgi:hypothetical protein
MRGDESESSTCNMERQFIKRKKKRKEKKKRKQKRKEKEKKRKENRKEKKIEKKRKRRNAYQEHHDQHQQGPPRPTATEKEVPRPKGIRVRDTKRIKRGILMEIQIGI